MSSVISPEEENWTRVGHGLNSTNRFLQKYVHKELRFYFQSIPRITDLNNPFSGCFCDSQGNPLRFAPENHPTPPAGDGIQLYYTALPHYESLIHQRSKDLTAKNIQTTPAQAKMLSMKNQPVSIKDEHELAHLFLQDFYKKLPGCNIYNLDASAILNILYKVDCFPVNQRNQASKVRDQVRNKWAHAIIREWTPTEMSNAFVELNNLAQIIPNSSGLINELDRDQKGSKTFEFPMKDFLLKINKYRDSVRNGNHDKVQEKLKKLYDVQGQEIYVDRKFKDTTTKEEFSEIEGLILKDETVLLKGEAGAGKSSVAVKAMQQWSEGNHMKNITCCLFLGAGSDAKIPLNKIIWDEHSDVPRWTDKEVKEAFSYLQDLADHGNLGFIIDGLDELGTMTVKDVSTASRAAVHPDLEVDIKTVCAGILAQKILPGSKVIATSRNVTLVNKEVLQDTATLYELIELTEKEIETLVEMMEKDTDERIRIQKELERVSMAANSHFLKTPLMTKNIIQLIIDKEVDIEKTKNSSEIYLMILMKNLDFHTDRNTSFTELDPPEDHDYLIMCLKLCQFQMQEILTHGESINTISGIQRNVKNVGQCFEAKVPGEVIRVPVEFIKKLGIFEYRKEDGLAYLDAVHLSFFEFCCAGSLCRNDVNICEELSKIINDPRFEAVIIYLSGMFARNASIEFLNICKHLCQNFLDLLDNNEREKSIQDVFKSIILRQGNLKPSKEKTSIILSLSLGEEIIIDKKSLGWLVEAMKAAATKVNTLYAITITDVTSWTELNEKEYLSQLIQLQKGYIEILRVNNSECELSDDKSPQFCAMTAILRESKNWKIGELKLGYNKGSFSSVKGEYLDSLHFKAVSCWQTNDVTLLCAMLKKSNYWTIEYLDLLNMYESNWTMLAEMANKGSIETVRVNETAIRVAKEEDLQNVWNSTTKEWTWGGMTCYARKSEEESGLQKILAIKNLEEEEWLKNQRKLIESKARIVNVDSFRSTTSMANSFTNKKQDSSVNYFELAKERELADEMKEIERMQLDYALRMSLKEEDTKDMAILEEGTEDMAIVEEGTENMAISLAQDIDKTPIKTLTVEEMIKNVQMTRMSLEEDVRKDGGYITEEEMLQMVIEESLDDIYEENLDEYSEYETCSSDLNESSNEEI